MSWIFYAPSFFTNIAILLWCHKAWKCPFENWTKCYKIPNFRTWFILLILVSLRKAPVYTIIIFVFLLLSIMHFMVYGFILCSEMVTTVIFQIRIFSKRSKLVLKHFFLNWRTINSHCFSCIVIRHDGMNIPQFFTFFKFHGFRISNFTLFKYYFGIRSDHLNNVRKCRLCALARRSQCHRVACQGWLEEEKKGS